MINIRDIKIGKVVTLYDSHGGYKVKVTEIRGDTIIGHDPGNVKKNFIVSINEVADMSDY